MPFVAALTASLCPLPCFKENLVREPHAPLYHLAATPRGRGLFALVESHGNPPPDGL